MKTSLQLPVYQWTTGEAVSMLASNTLRDMLVRETSTSTLNSRSMALQGLTMQESTSYTETTTQMRVRYH